MWAMLLCAALLLVAEPAHAWGPITHLTHGAEVLERVTILGMGLQRLLRRHRLEFLYGCVGADITQAKKYTRAQQAHCHSWSVGWSILERAENDRERAFAYGYLTHLVGDVFSHNHYVPTQLIVSFRARALRHIYWEARFDTMQPDERRALVREIRHRAFPECDALVERVVSRTLLPFAADKRIFDYFIAIHDLDQWHGIIRQLTSQSRYRLPPETVAEYNGVVHANAVDMLSRGRKSDCQSADPTGAEALALAHRTRETLRLLDRQGKVTPKLRARIAALALDRHLDLPCCQPLEEDPAPLTAVSPKP